MKNNDLVLLKKILEENCEESLLLLIEKYQNYYFKIIGKMDVDISFPVILWQAIQQYNPQKSNFSTWLWKYLSYVKWSAIKKHSYREVLQSRFAKQDFFISNNNSVFIDLIHAIPNDRQKTILKKYFIDGDSHAQIARDLSLSHTQIQKDYKAAIDFLKKDVLN